MNYDHHHHGGTETTIERTKQKQPAIHSSIHPASQLVSQSTSQLSHSIATTARPNSIRNVMKEEHFYELWVLFYYFLFFVHSPFTHLKRHLSEFRKKHQYTFSVSPNFLRSYNSHHPSHSRKMKRKINEFALEMTQLRFAFLIRLYYLEFVYLLID